MEKELKDRLAKLVNEFHATGDAVADFLTITQGTLEALRAHINELHPASFGDVGMLEDTIEIIEDYQ